MVWLAGSIPLFQDDQPELCKFIILFKYLLLIDFIMFVIKHKCEPT